MNNLLSIVLQQKQPIDSTMNMYIIGGMVVIFYVFMILPQSRKNKAQKKFREEIQKGDKVITLSGIHGKITKMDETTMVVEVESGAEIKFERVAIDVERTKASNPEKWGAVKK